MKRRFLIPCLAAIAMLAAWVEPSSAAHINFDVHEGGNVDVYHDGNDWSDSPEDFQQTSGSGWVLVEARNIFKFPDQGQDGSYTFLLKDADDRIVDVLVARATLLNDFQYNVRFEFYSDPVLFSSVINPHEVQTRNLIGRNGFGLPLFSLSIDIWDGRPTSVPEPATLLLFGLGLAGLTAGRYRQGFAILKPSTGHSR